jgi:UDP-glucose:(heptosyl)LPS alpha-1,3-glucosyltransferase
VADHVDAAGRSRRLPEGGALMRLAIVRQHYVSTRPAERQVERALEALLERNVAISLYTRSWPQTRLNLIEPVICDAYHAGALWREWSFTRSACAAIGDAPADLVYSLERILCCDVYHAADGVYAAWLDEQRRAAGVLRRARLALGPYHRYMQWTERRLFASAWLQKVVCPSKLVRDDIRERYGLPYSKLPVVYNAVDNEALSPALRGHRAAVRAQHGIADGATVFLLAATDAGAAATDAAIPALARLTGLCHLIVAAEAATHDRCMARAATFGVADRVTLVDSRTDLRPYVGAADAFVAPALYDPAAVTTLEAMACGLPAIVSTRSGAAELVREHDAGRICVATDVAGLAIHMRALLDRPLRERLGANAREAVATLTPAAMTLQLVLLFKDLLTASAHARADAKAAAEARRAARRAAWQAARKPGSTPDVVDPAAATETTTDADRGPTITQPDPPRS